MKKVVVNPHLMNGKPHLVGTKITVSSILKKLAKKQTVQQISRQFPQLDEEDVIVAIKYVDKLVEKISNPDD